MAKKKKPAARVNRGFATTSMPSKEKSLPNETESTEKQVSKEPSPLPPMPPPIDQSVSVHSEQTQQQEEEEEDDKAMRLAKRFSFINKRKAEALFQKLSQPDSITDDNEMLRSFALTANIEFDLFRILKSQQPQENDALVSSHLQIGDQFEYEKLVGTLDVIYRTLIKLGFKAEDVEDAFKATSLTDIHELLDWLCVHVPYERMPVGFYDKYFTEEGMSIRAELAAEDQDERERHVEASQEQQLRDEMEEKEDNGDVDDYKARILQAAQRQYDEDSETEEDLNEKHARHKLELVQLEEQLPSGKKNKKNSSLTSGGHVQYIQGKINTLRQTLKNLEDDWMFDKIKSAELFAKLDHEATEKLREAQKTQQQVEPPQPQEYLLFPNKEENPKEEEKDTFGGDDDGYYGLFGNMLDEPQQEETSMTSTSTTSEWEVVEVSKKGWIGRQPKDMLAEYCKKHDFVKHVYTKSELSATRWRATVILTPRHVSMGETLVEIPDNLATKSSKDAEQLVATAALFQLDPSSAVYNIMPPPLKELWLKWIEQKGKEELKAQLEDSRQRMQMFVDIIDASPKNQEYLENSTPEAPDTQPRIKPREGQYDKQQNEARKSMFKGVQRSFEKRIKSDVYLKMKEKRSELPMTAYRDEVLRLVRENQVVIVSGETGCGKSTQVPQFLAEEVLLGKHDYGSVICTQPRRISAMSIAKRVSQEMGDYPQSLGTKNGMVGYQIRLESKVADENVLVFCTTGILLRRLESDRELRGITHVIVDEIHERTLDSDFLLIILRQLCHRRPDLKVVLMSATVEAHRFSNYFGGCPVMAVPGRTFPVQVKYLEDVIEATGYTLEEDSRYAIPRERVQKVKGSVRVTGGHGTSHNVRYDWFDGDDDPYNPTRIESKLTIKKAEDSGDDDGESGEPQQMYSEQTIKTLQRIDENKINYDLILDLLDYICIRAKEPKDSDVPKTGAILVFLPGMPEIRRLYDMVAAHKELGDPKKFILIALHSTLSSEHQERAFDIPPPGIRKIVLSTNIAETGVTITDVTVVIDTGMAKVVSYDQKRRITRLRQQFITKANARQRRGRAGRVQEGLCFHLFEESRFLEMADYETPEILRLPLEELCLRIKVCDLGSIKEFLSTALDAPSPDIVETAIETLQEVQALSTDGLESLTSLGTHLANLPVDVHIGKMILFGAIFRCLDPVLTIAAALSFKSPFVRPFGKEHEADMARAKFRYADSDFWTICKAYQSWRAQLQKLQGKPGWSRKIRSFCDMNFLSESNLETIEDMKRQYLELLSDIGFVNANDKELQQNRYGRGMRWCPIPMEYDENSGSVPVVNAAIMAGLYPKLALRKEGVFENAKYSGMHIHPSSMLHGREFSLLSDFLVYNTVVMNHDRIYLWEAAAIDPVAVMLLCSDMEIKHKQKVVVLDKWIKFQCFARSAALLKFLRSELNNWLTAKMKKPDLDLTSYNHEIMDIMIRTLESRME